MGQHNSRFMVGSEIWPTRAVRGFDCLSNIDFASRNLSCVELQNGYYVFLDNKKLARGEGLAPEISAGEFIVEPQIVHFGR